MLNYNVCYNHWVYKYWSYKSYTTTPIIIIIPYFQKTKTCSQKNVKRSLRAPVFQANRCETYDFFESFVQQQKLDADTNANDSFQHLRKLYVVNGNEDKKYNT